MILVPVLHWEAAGPAAKVCYQGCRTLRKLDLEGRVLHRRSITTLRRTQACRLAPLACARDVHAIGDAGRFTECLTRRTWPVAQERDSTGLKNRPIFRPASASREASYW